MSSAVEKIEEILQTDDYQNIFELISLALSIKDEEDRDLQLFYIARWLLKRDDWQRAYGIAEFISEGYEKSEALQIIAEKMAEGGYLERALFVFSQAERHSKSETLANWQKAELLHKIAKSLRKNNAIFKAEEIWEKAISIAKQGQESENPQDSVDCSSVLAEIAEHLASDGSVKQAFEITQNIKSVGIKERTTKRISKYSDQIQKVA